MSRKKHEEEPVEDAIVEDIVGDVEEAPPEEDPVEEQPVEDPSEDHEIAVIDVDAVDPETLLGEYDPDPVNPNTVGGGVPFEADTRTVAEQLAALTPGVG